jgi:hypothetical protein
MPPVVTDPRRRWQYGKTPARNLVKLQLKDYFRVDKMDPLPAEFGYEELMTAPVGMNGNDSAGDCAEAGAEHEEMLWAAMAGQPIPPFDQNTAFSDYSAITGFDPNDPNTDQGTDMMVMAKYRQDTGMIDGNGKRWKIDLYAALEPKDFEQMLYAIHYFGLVGIGLEMQKTTQDQFGDGQPWSVTSAAVEGGHYIPGIAFRHQRLKVYTWGATEYVDEDYYTTFNDEALVYLSLDMLRANQKTLLGLDFPALERDFVAVKGL